MCLFTIPYIYIKCTSVSKGQFFRDTCLRKRNCLCMSASKELNDRALSLPFLYNHIKYNDLVPETFYFFHIKYALHTR